MMKEKLCYVGYNIEQEQKLALETTVLVESYTVSSHTYTQSHDSVNFYFASTRGQQREVVTFHLFSSFGGGSFPDALVYKTYILNDVSLEACLVFNLCIMGILQLLGYVLLYAVHCGTERECNLLTLSLSL